jgi:hypothetical protein
MPDNYRRPPKQSDRLHSTGCIAFRDDITIKIDDGGGGVHIGCKRLQGCAVCLFNVHPNQIW